MIVGSDFASGSGFVSPGPAKVDPDGLPDGDVSDLVLVIFLHGSEQEWYNDNFVPGEVEYSTTPAAVKHLAGEVIAGKTVIVLEHGSPVMPVPGSAAGTKFNKRFEVLGRVLQRFCDKGFSRSQIFVAGHSAGGWLALQFLAEHPDAYTAAIAFAPAFAGRPGREANWEQLRTEKIDRIKKANSLPALVYAFANDEWEAQSERAFLRGIADVELINYPGEPAKQLATSPFLYHCGAFHPSFEFECHAILKFMESKLSP